MCIDYTSLNKACPKDEYSLPCICQIVDSTVSYELLAFLDAYLSYHQISIIASGLFLLDVVLIGQLHINLMIGVEVLDYKPIGYVSYRLKDDQNDSRPYRRRVFTTVG
jgi:hypothetical protein